MLCEQDVAVNASGFCSVDFFFTETLNKYFSVKKEEADLATKIQILKGTHSKKIKHGLRCEVTEKRVYHFKNKRNQYVLSSQELQSVFHREAGSLLVGSSEVMDCD